MKCWNSRVLLILSGVFYLQAKLESSSAVLLSSLRGSPGTNTGHSNGSVNGYHNTYMIEGPKLGRSPPRSKSGGHGSSRGNRSKIFTQPLYNTSTIKMRIQNTSHTINVTWEQPDKSKNPMCYSSDLQYRSFCYSSWQTVKDIKGFSFVLPAPDMKKNYAFRIRTRLQCISGNWGEWSPEKYWKNDTGPCIADTLQIHIKNYVLVTVLPVVFLLLLYAVTKERVRRLVLPIIPDPKNIQESILNIEQFQWFTSFSHVCEECEMVEIEVDPQKEEEEKNEITDEPPTQKATDAVSESCDLDLTMNTSLFFVYSSDSPEHMQAPQFSHTMPGYITI